MYNISIRK